MLKAAVMAVMVLIGCSGQPEPAILASDLCKDCVAAGGRVCCLCCDPEDKCCCLHVDRCTCDPKDPSHGGGRR